MAPFTKTESNRGSNRVPLAKLPRLCVAVQGTTPGELAGRARQAARENPLVELRLDALTEPETNLSAVAELTRALPQTLFLATCRRRIAGGEFAGTAESEWNILTQAAEAGCALADLAVESARELPLEKIDALRRRATLVLSWHDFTAMPDLETALGEMRAFPADVYKLVPTAQRFADNARLLAFVESHAAAVPLVAFCMGEWGLPSRVLSLRAGCVFTFASLKGEAGTAPGQVDEETMRALYGAERLSSSTRVYGVLGYPLGHSLSPLMQNAAFQHAGLDAVYLPLATPSADDLFDHAERLGLEGFSVTIPHKSAVVRRLSRVDELAARVGAVNTVVRRGAEFHGFNTDVAGIVKPLERLVALRGARVLVLGAGGAARAAVFGLGAEGAEVTIFNRTLAHAEELAGAAGAEVLADRGQLRVRDFDVIVNTTPVGQFPRTGVSPLQPEELRAGVVFDLVYNPMETELIRLARRAGLRIIPGVEMFVHQGARQFELWTEQPAPVEAMRHVVMDFLSAREKSRL